MADRRRFTWGSRSNNRQFSYARRSFPSALAVVDGEPFGAGYADEDVLAKAEADASARLYDPGVWGSNRTPYPMCAIARAAETGQSLLGHQLDAARAAGAESDLERLLVDIPLREAEVLTAIGDLEAARIAEIKLRQRLEQEKLPRPDPRPWRPWAKALILAGLVAGEVFVLTSPFQVLGLSDRPLFWFVTAQNLGALSGIVALLVLAHGLAAKPPHERHRVPGGGRWHERLAARSEGYRASILGVVAALLGLAAVRESYLDASGKGNGAVAIGFLLLNLAIVLAARWAARPDARPYAAQWRGVLADVADAEERLEETSTTYEQQLGTYNARRVHRDALISQYDHATAATRSDAHRQIAEFAAAARLGQPEPVTETMFDAELPAPTPNEFTTELRAYCLQQTGAPTRYQRYARLAPTAVRQRHEQMEQAVAQARRERDATAVASSGLAHHPTEAPPALQPSRRRPPPPPPIVVSASSNGTNGSEPA